jgi:phosphatidylglycerophosphatase B
MNVDSDAPVQSLDNRIRPIRNVLPRLLLIVVPICALLPLTYVLPGLNPLKATTVDLTGPVAVAAYGISESASELGIPLLAVAVITILVSRSGISAKQRAVEAAAMAVVLLALLGGGSYLNEHVVKALYQTARPNILFLGKPPEAPALKLTVQEFYQLPDKATRSTHLAAVLTSNTFTACRLHHWVREHWIAETGFSFPSGHSFAAMMFATFSLAMALSHFSGPRLWLFYALLAWAVAACYSRLILCVHSPTDVTVGGIEGVALGIVGFLMVRGLVRIGGPAAAEAALSHPTFSASLS